ncbi:MAG: hypothetical protein MUE42_02635 [Opitutaceae bacterium]|nr:hypothetical protein [Opitutaceae bacterium]
MGTKTHPRLGALFDFAAILEETAREMTKEARKRAEPRRPRTRRGTTLRPGADTPLWNALAEMSRPLVQKRGARAILARELGVHRARIGEYFDKHSAMPDAERALRLFVLLAQSARRSTQNTAPTNVRNTNIGAKT